MRRLLVGVSVVAACFSALGCATAEPRQGAPGTEGEAVDVATDDIVGGTVDNGNDAVVAILTSDGGLCSGTIIAKNGSTGYVLSAGHCKASSYFILQADDYADCIDGNTLDPSLPGCDDVYQSTGDLRHPQYTEDYFNDGSGVPGWDFLLIKFSGANANTPVMPADDGSANLQNGDGIEFSGYGLMNQGGSLVETSQRRHAFNNVGTIYGEPPIFDYSEGWNGPGGPCSGDSGGPAIKSGYVVGVTSFGDQNCQTDGYSSWVESQYAGFIAPYIGADVPAQTCDECVNSSVSGGQCTASLTACQNDASCSALLTCFSGCSTDACYNDCAAANPGGVDAYNAIVTCAYCDACDPICNADFCDGGATTGSGPSATVGVGAGVGTGVGTGAGATTGTGAGAGDAVGATTGTGDTGAGGANAGSGGDDGGSKKSGGSDDSSSSGDSATADEGGCAVAQTGAPSHSGIFGFGIAGLAFAVAANRRRRS